MNYFDFIWSKMQGSACICGVRLTIPLYGVQNAIAGLLLLNWLKAWISNPMFSKMWGEITYYSGTMDSIDTTKYQYGNGGSGL